MNKKAITEAFVVLVIILAVAVISIGLASKLKDFFKEDTDIETCRLSVLAHSQTKKAPVVGSMPSSFISLDCPRRSLVIYDDKVEINGKKSRKFTYNKLTQVELNRILAEELRLCWYKMGEGKLNIINQGVMSQSAQYYNCLICDEISFNEKLSGSFAGLKEYITSTNIPGNDITYSDYLIKSQKDLYLLGILPYTQYTPWFSGSTGKIDEQPVYLDKKYVIYFLAFKPVWALEKAGAYSSAYYIGLGTPDQLKSECEVLIN